MSDMPALFTIDDEGRYVPEKWAYGRWGADEC